jgi:serine/threonine protein kinase
MGRSRKRKTKPQEAQSDSDVPYAPPYYLNNTGDLAARGLPFQFSGLSLLNPRTHDEPSSTSQPWIDPRLSNREYPPFVDPTWYNEARTHTTFPSPQVPLSIMCGLSFDHQIYPQLQPSLFIVVNALGHGSLGVVDEVRVSHHYPSFVRKRIQLPSHLRSQRLRIIKEEAEVLKKLNHVHVITMIGSYQESPSGGRHFYSLLMSPVGEGDLHDFLETVGTDVTDSDNKVFRKSALKRWFKCLASALEYIHGQGVRHQDIKPSNIIYRSNTDIYFTDFSSAAQFEVGQTTSTDNPARTSARYAAPELIDADDFQRRHGRATDVFSLGTVFCEMLAVIRGSSVHKFREALQPLASEKRTSSTGPSTILCYGRVTARIHEYFTGDPFYQDCVRGMLARNRKNRPNSSAVATAMRAHDHWGHLFCRCDGSPPSPPIMNVLNVPQPPYQTQLNIPQRYVDVPLQTRNIQPRTFPTPFEPTYAGFDLVSFSNK